MAKKDWQDFDRMMGHTRVGVMIPLRSFKKAWKWVFGKKAAPVYQPDDVDRAIDKAIEGFGK